MRFSRRRFAAAATIAVLAAGGVEAGAGPARAQDITYFQIGTGATGGTYFPIGGLIASAVSAPPGSPACGQAGRCGVPGVVAVAQATAGSRANVEAIRDRRMESALVQADVAADAYAGKGVFSGKRRAGTLRAIANLFPEALHLVVRADSKITSIRGLGSKKVAIGEKGSGTEFLVRRLLPAYGLADRDLDPIYLKPDYLKPSRVADGIRAGTVDAAFLMAGYPVPVLSSLARQTGIRLLPITGKAASAVRRGSSHLVAIEIPGGTYDGIPEPIKTLGVGAQWIVGADVPDDLVYQLTRALWHETTRASLDRGHPAGRAIVLETALQGLAVPLHPGAERFYREKGLIADAPPAKKAS